MKVGEKQDMSAKDRALRKRFHLIGVVILAAGFPAAALIFILAAPGDGSGAIGYEIVDGKSYPVMPGDSERYEYDLERIGGKSAVLAAEFNHWFASLWHGRKLAYTLAFLSAGSSLACFYLAHLLADPPPRKGPNGGQGP
jgi:hypothetical protein